jgi:hypothetical protein
VRILLDEMAEYVKILNGSSLVTDRYQYRLTPQQNNTYIDHPLAVFWVQIKKHGRARGAELHKSRLA